jgi:hypothetical protein
MRPRNPIMLRPIARSALASTSLAHNRMPLPEEPS